LCRMFYQLMLRILYLTICIVILNVEKVKECPYEIFVFFHFLSHHASDRI
jgi:hypothetical protein